MERSFFDTLAFRLSVHCIHRDRAAKDMNVGEVKCIQFVFVVAYYLLLFVQKILRPLAPCAFPDMIYLQWRQFLFTPTLEQNNIVKPYANMSLTLASQKRDLASRLSHLGVPTPDFDRLFLLFVNSQCVFCYWNAK